MHRFKSLVICFIVCFIIGCSKGLKVTVKGNVELEYGGKLDDSLLFDKENSDEDVSVKEVKNFDHKKTGEQEITVIFTNSDDKTKKEMMKVTVKDTKKPVIKFKKDKVEITEGDKFDAAANIESVKDPVDGDLKKSDDKKLTKNGYTITSDVDSKKAGSYTVKVAAFDVNGNKTESSYKVTVKEKPQEQAPVVQQPITQTPNQSSTQTSNNSGYSNNQGSGTTNNSAPITNNPPAPQPTPSTNNNGSSNQNNKKPQQPAVTKKVCPNGNEPIDPNLPCDAWYSGGYDQCYKDASGNIVAFPTAEEANKWAYNALLNDSSFDIYAGYVTTPIGKNDNSHYHGVTFN